MLAFRRISAFCIDYGLVLAYIFLLFALSDLLPDGLFRSDVSAQITGFFLLTFPIASYFVLTESSVHQATLGKRALRLKVVDFTGERLPIFQAIIRSTAFFIPWEIAHFFVYRFDNDLGDVPLLGSLMAMAIMLAGTGLIFVTPKHQTLWDYLSSSHVVFRT